MNTFVSKSGISQPELDALHGKDDAQLPPQDQGDVTIGAVYGANNRETTVCTSVQGLNEIVEVDDGGNCLDVGAHCTADRRDVRFPSSANGHVSTCVYGQEKTQSCEQSQKRLHT